MSRFRKLSGDKKLMSGIYAVTLVTALLILALAVKGPEESGTLIADRNGNIIGINRRSLSRSRARIDLRHDDPLCAVSRRGYMLKVTFARPCRSTAAACSLSKFEILCADCLAFDAHLLAAQARRRSPAALFSAALFCLSRHGVQFPV